MQSATCTLQSATPPPLAAAQHRGAQVAGRASEMPRADTRLNGTHRATLFAMPPPPLSAARIVINPLRAQAAHSCPPTVAACQ
eukprot:3573527-Pleurochrysis_carterae.AAC.1